MCMAHINTHACQAEVAHAFNPRTWKAEADGSFELQASLVYKEKPRLEKTKEKKA